MMPNSSTRLPQQPYGQWVKESRLFLADLSVNAKGALKLKESLLDTQQAFGYTQEDIKFILEPMAENGEEATGSMGNDSALPVLSSREKPLYVYFKQALRAGD